MPKLFSSTNASYLATITITAIATSVIAIFTILELTKKKNTKDSKSPSPSEKIRIAAGLDNHPEGPNIGFSSGKSWLSSPTDTTFRPKGSTGKLVVVMVGLPGRGKTYIARKLARYLRWVNQKTFVFSLAKYRLDAVGPKLSEFFNEKNAEFYSKRIQTLYNALDNLISYLHRDGDVAILDGTHTSLDRRQIIRNRIAKENNFQILWVEAISDSPESIDAWIKEQKNSPDFLGAADYDKRMQYYQQNYVSVNESEGSYMKIFDNGKKLELNAIHGFLPTKIAGFTLNLHTAPRPIYLVRHGESEFNVQGLIGGDSDLSPKGVRFSQALAEYLSLPESGVDSSKLIVWTSCMRRARNTALLLPCASYVECPALREMEAGVCDGLRFDQIKAQFPEEYRACRQDMLRFRYPRAENYIDVIARLEPLIYELEQLRDPIIVVAHQAVLRCLYAYFMDVPSQEIPFLSMPLHKLIKLEPKAFGCVETRTDIELQDA